MSLLLAILGGGTPTYYQVGIAESLSIAEAVGESYTSSQLLIGNATIKQHMLIPGSTVPGTTTTDPINTQASGGAMIVAIARGEWATGSPVAPTGNLGNTFSLQAGPNSYASFPTSKTAVYAALDNAGGTGQTGTVAWGSFSGTAQDEATIALVEIVGLCSLQTSSFVERTSAATVTSASVTTTGPALIVWFVCGTANVGQLHTWTSSDSTKIAAASAEGDPDPNGYIQMASFYRNESAAGTYTATFTGTASEGAQIYALAFQARASSLFTANVSETLTLAEVIASLMTARPAPAETVTLGESVAPVMSATVAVAETLTLAESLSAGLLLTAAVAETLTLAESVVAQLTMVATVAETVTIAESTGVTATAVAGLSETITLVETATLAATLQLALSETLTVAESMTGGLLLTAGVAESLTLAESLASSRLAVVALAESVTASEALAAATAAAVALVEAVTASEALAAGLLLTASVAEAVTLAESLSVARTAIVGLAESVAASEALSAQVSAAVAANESLTLAEAIAASSVYQAALADALAILESVIGDSSGNGAPALFATLVQLNYLTSTVVAVNALTSTTSTPTALTATTETPAMTLTMYKETTWRERITVRDASGVPYDLTANSVTLDAIVARRTTDPALITLAVGSGITLLNQTTNPGEADLEILPAQIAALTPGPYVLAVGATIGAARQLALTPQRMWIRDTPG